MKKTETILSAIGIILALVTLVFGDNIYERITGNSIEWLGTSEQTAKTTPETSEESEVAPTSKNYFSDNFNSGLDFDQTYWKKSEDDECVVKQTGGVVELRATGLNQSNALCLVDAEETTFENTGATEARIKTSGGASGDYSIGIIEFSNGTFDEGSQNWIIQCGILQIPNNNNQVEVFFNVHSTYPQGEPEIYKSIPASIDHWYSVKLEIDPNEDKISCYADKQLIGTYTGSNITELHKKKLRRHILGFWSPYSQATFFVDDVKFSPPR